MTTQQTATNAIQEALRLIHNAAMLPAVFSYAAAPLSEENTAIVSDARPSLRTVSRIAPTL